MNVDPQHILDELADAVIAMTPDGHIVYVNRSFERLLGWTDSELRGQSLAMLQPARLRDTEGNVFSPYVRRRQGQDADVPVTAPALRRDGSEIEVEIRLSKPSGGSDDLMVAS